MNTGPVLPYLVDPAQQFIEPRFGSLSDRNSQGLVTNALLDFNLLPGSRVYITSVQ
jgi:hypothetical protein